tara:strand:- start:1299 stop:1589 length:291 start_codon:yes stop_codon:yes gene_type:complete
MANHTKTITLSDEDQKLLADSINTDTDNAGIDAWIQNAVDGKVHNCWKRFQNEWTKKLMDDPSFTDPIPSVKADFITLVTARSDYKTRKQRDSGTV